MNKRAIQHKLDHPTGVTIARLVERAKPDELDANSAAALKLAGVYRVIHGTLEIPRPIAERLNPDGTDNPFVPKTITVRMGDEVALGDEDAWRMLAYDKDPAERHKFAVVEPLDTRPSRVGKVWEPPKPTSNASGYAAAGYTAPANLKPAVSKDFK
jgi:hypothetical protein